MSSDDIIFYFLDGNLPHGVRIFQVYVNETSYQEIKHVAELTPYSLLKRAESLSSECTKSSDMTNDDEKESVTRSCIPFVEPVQINEDNRNVCIQKSASEDCENSMALQEDKGNFPIFRSNSVANSAPFSSRSNSYVDGFSSISSDYTESSQMSYHRETLPSSQDSEIDIVWDRKYGGDLSDLKESVRQFNKSYENAHKSTVSHETLSGWLNSDFSETLPHVENSGFGSSLRRSLSCEGKLNYFVQNDKEEDGDPNTSDRSTKAYQGVVRSGGPSTDTLISDTNADTQCNISSEHSQYLPALYCINSEPHTEYGTTCEITDRGLLEDGVTTAVIDHTTPLDLENCERSRKQGGSETYGVGGDYLDSVCTEENCKSSTYHNEHCDKTEVLPKVCFRDMTSATSQCSATDLKYENIEHSLPTENQNNVPQPLTDRDHQVSMRTSSRNKSFIDLSYKNIAQRNANGSAIGEDSFANEGNSLLHDKVCVL